MLCVLLRNLNLQHALLGLRKPFSNIISLRFVRHLRDFIVNGQSKFPPLTFSLCPTIENVLTDIFLNSYLLYMFLMK